MNWALLCALGVGFSAAGFLAGAFNRVPRWKASGWIALGYALHAGGVELVDGSMGLLAVDAAFIVGFGWHWWRGVEQRRRTPTGV